MPVMIAARLGAHTGAVVNACVYLADSRANRSRTGVRASVSPYAPMCGLISSFEIHTMLGRACNAGAFCAAEALAVAATIESATRRCRVQMTIIVSGLSSSTSWRFRDVMDRGSDCASRADRPADRTTRRYP